MAGKSLPPSCEPLFQAPVTLMTQWEGNVEGGVVGERQNNRYRPLHVNTAATKAPKEYSTILAVTTNDVPWEPALVSLTADWPRLLSSTQLTLLNFHLTNFKFFILLY